MMKKMFVMLVALIAVMLLCCSGAGATDWPCKGCGRVMDFESIPYSYDETHCWKECPYCGLVFTKYTHLTYCDIDRTSCYTCGQKAPDIVIDRFYHNHGGQGFRTEYDERQHWKVCPGCNEMVVDDFSPAQHQVGCQHTSQCTACAATVFDAEYPPVISHEAYKRDGGHDRTHHWDECTACGWKSEEKFKHIASCLTPNICKYCGEENSIVEPDYFSHNSIWMYTQDECWWGCTDCGNEEDRMEHLEWCNGSGVCVQCGLADVNFHGICHKLDGYQYNDERHWVICTICGDVLEDSKHYVRCDGDQNVCGGCGTAGVTIGETRHLAGNMQSNQNEHWYECALCGEAMYKALHYRVCAYPDAGCFFCEQTNVNINILFHEVSYEHDADAHWVTCPRCGEIPPAPHLYWNGYCQVCGCEEPLAPAVQPGDASGDGKTDIFDALAILQYAVGWDTDLNPDAGDVNDDGKCDIFDALLILQYSVGWDVELK